MKFTVVMSPMAEHQLAEIWVQASERASISQAFDRIETLLKRDAKSLGRLNPGGWRVVTLGPLAVKVMSVFYRS